MCAAAPDLAPRKPAGRVGGGTWPSRPVEWCEAHNRAFTNPYQARGEVRCRLSLSLSPQGLRQFRYHLPPPPRFSALSRYANMVLCWQNARGSVRAIYSWSGISSPARPCSRATSHHHQHRSRSARPASATRTRLPRPSTQRVGSARGPRPTGIVPLVTANEQAMPPLQEWEIRAARNPHHATPDPASPAVWPLPPRSVSQMGNPPDPASEMYRSTVVCGCRSSLLCRHMVGLQSRQRIVVLGGMNG